MRPLALGLRAPYRLKRTIALLAQATLNLDFTRGGPIDSRVTFTRASGGTSFRPVSYGPELVASQDLTTWVSGGAFGNWAGTTTTSNTITTTGANGARRVRIACTPDTVYRMSATVTGGTGVGSVAIAFGTSANVYITHKDELFVASGVASSMLLAPPNAAFVEFAVRGGNTGQTTSFASITASAILLDRPGDPIQLFTAPANVPRFDYDPVTRQCKGLLIEEQRTNLLTDSHELHTWSSSGATKAANVALAPDGTMTADSFVPTAAPGHHEVYKSLVVGAVNALATDSIFVKQLGSYTKVRMADAGNGTFAASFDLVTGAVSNTSGARFVSAGMEKLIDGWWRCHVVQTSDGTATARSVCGYPDNAVLDLYGCTYTGDGVSGVLVWGAQFEAGAFTTSYIPTSGAAATRSLDQPVVNTLSPWYNSAEGTLFMDVGSSKGTATYYATAASLVGSATGVNYVVASFNTLNTSALITGGSTMVQPAVVSGQVAKVALGLSPTSQSMVINGGTPITRAAAAPLNQMTALRIGYWEGNPGQLNGHIRRVAYWPRRMSNLDLQGLTR